MPPLVYYPKNPTRDTPIVSEFARRGGFTFILNGNPRFLVEIVTKEKRVQGRRKKFTVSANFVNLSGSNGGAEIVYTSTKDVHCVLGSRSGLFLCHELPDRLIYAVLYLFIHR